MTKKQLDERQVYLACRCVFVNEHAALRDLEKIQKVIQKRRKGEEQVNSLIQEYDIEQISIVAKSLLERRIFESNETAKTYFPDLFKVSALQNTGAKASHAKAATNTVKPESPDRPLATSDWCEKKDPGGSQESSSQTSHSQNHLSAHVSKITSLYPVYLPMKMQHQVLVAAQHVLEEACYKFAKKNYNSVLESKGWDCPEAVELGCWRQLLLSHQNKFSPDTLAQMGKPLAKIFDSMTTLRNVAVHREKIAANKIQQFMIDAESLARLLQDMSCLETLRSLRRRVQLTIDDLKRNKDLLELRLSEKLSEIAAQRSKLNELEQNAVEHMLEKDKEYAALTVSNLDSPTNSANHQKGINTWWRTWTLTHMALNILRPDMAIIALTKAVKDSPSNLYPKKAQLQDLEESGLE